MLELNLTKLIQLRIHLSPSIILFYLFIVSIINDFINVFYILLIIFFNKYIINIKNKCYEPNCMLGK